MIGNYFLPYVTNCLLIYFIYSEIIFFYVLNYHQIIQKNMNHNFLNLIVYDYGAIQHMTMQICQVLKKYYNEDNVNTDSSIEIEYKYAEFKEFCNSNYMNPIIGLSNKEVSEKAKNQMLKIAEYYVLQQSRLHLQSIKTMSNSSLILLNHFGRKIYEVQGGFDEDYHKRFYKMRQFLLRLSQQNQKVSSNQKNYYAEIKNLKGNKGFKVQHQSEMRFDISVKNKQKGGRGRYSYQLGKGWSSTNKLSLLREQFDLMMKQRIFRLACKKQEEIAVETSEIEEVLSSQQALNSAFVRIKRALKVVKNQMTQFSLSQIYQPKPEVRAQLLQDLKVMINQPPEKMKQFIYSAFQRFYLPSEPKDQQRKFEIQLEYTRKGVEHMNNLCRQRKYLDIENFIASTLGDLYALYFADHTIKTKQSKILDELSKKQNQFLHDNEETTKQHFPQARLQNQIGNYMHLVIKQHMES